MLITLPEQLWASKIPLEGIIASVFKLGEAPIVHFHDVLVADGKWGETEGTRGKFWGW
jgi:hypothetical protein